jgi:hypothetical protein
MEDKLNKHMALGNEKYMKTLKSLQLFYFISYFTYTNMLHH